jgi:hypothetical protein
MDSSIAVVVFEGGGAGTNGSDEAYSSSLSVEMMLSQEHCSAGERSSKQRAAVGC